MAEFEISVLSGIEKAKLQAILKYVKFVKDNETDAYKCKNCGQIALYHYEAKCKHIFCGKCHGQHYRKQCPIKDCPNASIVEITHSKEFEFGIYQLKAYCKFQQYGCEEEMVLSKLLAHQEVCKFSSKKVIPNVWEPSARYEDIKQLEDEVVSLKKIITEMKEDTFKLKDNLEAVNKSIDSQIKSVKQDLSFETPKQVVNMVDKSTQELEIKISKAFKQLQIDKQEIKDEVETSMNKQKQNLSSEIDESADRKFKLKTHEFDARVLETSQQCYIDAKSKHKEIEIYKNQVKQDLKSDVNKITDTKIEMKTQELENSASGTRQQLESELQKLTALVETRINKVQENVTCEVAKLVTQTKDLQGKILLAKQNLEMQPYQFNWSVKKFSRPEYVNKTFISNDLKYAIYAKFIYDDDNSDSIYLKTKCFPYNEGISYNTCAHKTTAIIIDQGDSNNIYNIIRIADTTFRGIHKTNEMFVSEKMLDNKYVTNDTIQIKILIEPLSILNLNPISSQNGIIIWKINNYKQRKENEISEFSQGISSEYFYSSSEGYKMKVRLFVSQTEIKIFLLIVWGKYDFKLPLRFKRKETFLVLDQGELNNEKKDIIHEIHRQGISKHSDYAVFDIAEIENAPYLLYDSLMIKVIVEAC